MLSNFSKAWQKNVHLAILPRTKSEMKDCAVLILQLWILLLLELEEEDGADVSAPKMCRWVIICEVHIFSWTCPFTKINK